MYQQLKILRIAAAISLALPMIAYAQVTKVEEQSQSTSKLKCAWLQKSPGKN